LKHALSAAALLCAASLVAPAGAQDVPAPPPAGVKPVPRKMPAQVPLKEGVPAQVVEPVPGVQSGVLPQIPENPIRLENEKPLQAPEAGPVPGQQPDLVPNQEPNLVPVQQPQAMPVAPVEPPVANVRPVKPKGPVYYYPVDPYTFPANVNTPPAMHVPNSPFVEDLSVAGDHGRYTYYSYRRPWYTPGHQSANVTIVW
jgi:hypothetical protein